MIKACIQDRFTTKMELKAFIGEADIPSSQKFNKQRNSDYCNPILGHCLDNFLPLLLTG